MKPASTAYQNALIAANAQITFAELFTFTLIDGTILRYTPFDLDVTYGGNTWISSGAQIKRGQIKEERGVKPNELTFKVFAQTTDIADLGLSVINSLANGFWDNATIRVDRAINPTLVTDGTASVTEIVPRFIGLFSGAQIGRSQAEITAKDYRWLLNTKFPVDVYQPGCRWTLFDTGCTLSRATFQVTSAVRAGSNTTSLVQMPVLTIAGGPGAGTSAPSGYFVQGVIKFTSGANLGIQRFVQSYLLHNATTNYQVTLLNDKPTGLYMLNDAAGSTTVLDSSGNAYNGTVVGGVTLGAAGGLTGDASTAAKFDGSTGYITLPIPHPLNSSDYGAALTIEFLMKLNNGATTEPVGIFDTAPGLKDTIRNYSDSSNGANNPGVEWWTNKPFVAIPNTPTGQYRHIVLVFRGGRTIDYYENGVLINSDTDATPNSFAWTNPINIGKVLPTGGGAPLGWFDGWLQGLAIYNFPLNQSMVSAHYKAVTTAPTTQNGQVQLVHPLPFVPKTGDLFTLTPGCDKTLATCIKKFNNKTNHGGFEFVPEPESAL